MAMVYLNTAAVLTKALSKSTDGSAAFRTKALGWLNEVIRDVLNQPRTWEFLKDSVSLSIVANQIVLPNGASEIICMTIGDTLLSPQNQLTEIDAFAIGTGGNSLSGYTLDSDNTVTFYPGATGACALRYEIDRTADYADNSSDTIFPLTFENLLVTGVRAHIYDYEKDGRYTKEMMLYDAEMRKMKSWDNRRKPAPKSNPHGYTRGSGISSGLTGRGIIDGGNA